MNVSHELLFLGIAVSSASLASGCFTARLDPDLAGVFACGGDDEASACPAGQTCVNASCEDVDRVPELAVIDPEDEQSLFRGDVVDLMMAMPGEPVTIDIVIQGSIVLVPADADADAVFGEGHVKVFVDGEEHVTLDSGSIDSPMIQRVSVRPVAGPHRILLQAHRNDGVAYDNPEATATRLFWFEHDDELRRRPFVAIKSPWPGTVFDLDEQDLTIELAAVQFEFRDPGSPAGAGQGHAHVAHDPRMDHPECVEDPGCDDVYLPEGVVGASRTAHVELPAGDVGSDRLTAVLRNTNHSPLGFPLGCDPTMAGPLDGCSPVFDTVEVVRVDDE